MSVTTEEPSARRATPAIPPHGRAIRVVLVDDHRVVRDAVKGLLGSVPDVGVVGEAADPSAALELVARVRADVALLDVRFPGGDGVELCAALQPEVRCIMLSAVRDEGAVLRALAAGAAGFLHKSIEPAVLVESIRRVAAGHVLYDEETARASRAHVAAARSATDGLAVLTSQERRVVRLMAEGKTNRRIADELFLAEKTVRNYVSNVLGKVGLPNRTALAAHVARLGGAAAIFGDDPT